jgi:AcrR family transcriptional regulator
MSAPAVAAAALPARAELSPARRRLFETALALFSSDGYHGVSVRDIVRELDQAPTAIYAHVRSKQELLFELIKMGHEELRDRIRLALLEAGNDPEAQLRAVVSANALTHMEFPQLARVSHTEAGFLSPAQLAVIDVLRTDLGALLRDVIVRGTALGAFDPPDEAIALYAVTTMGVHLIDWWSPERGLDPAYVARTQSDLAMRMLTR